MYPAIVTQFWPLTAFAFVVAVVAVAYYRFTKPGEALSWWAVLINWTYERLTRQVNITPEWLANRIGESVIAYRDAVLEAHGGDDRELNRYGIFLEREGFKTSVYFRKEYIETVTSAYLVSNLESINWPRTTLFTRFQWVLKPILTCEKCIAGQFAFWLFLWLMPFTLLSLFYVIALASYLASYLVNRLNA